MTDPAKNPAFKAWAAQWFRGEAAQRTIMREIDSSEAFAAGRAAERERIRQRLADKGWRTYRDGRVPLPVILDLLDEETDG